MNVQHSEGLLPGMGKSYFVSNEPDNRAATVKIDVFYTNDPFIQTPIVDDNIRMATIDEIVAMKMDVVQRGGRNL